MTTGLQDIPLDLIDGSPFETRERIETLLSVETLGVLSPPLVRPKRNGRFELVAGHRRIASLRAGGESSALCKVVDLDDEDAAVALYQDNADREGLSDFALGEFFQRFMHRFGVSTREAANRLDVDHGTIVRCVGIVETFKLVVAPATVKVDADAYKSVITEHKFKEANKLPEAKKLKSLAQIAENGLSTSETRALVSSVQKGEAPGRAANRIILARETRRAEAYGERKRRVECPTCQGKGWILSREGRNE